MLLSTCWKNNKQNDNKLSRYKMDNNYDFEDAGKQCKMSQRSQILTRPRTAISLHSYVKEHQEHDTEQLVNYNKVCTMYRNHLTEDSDNAFTSYKACRF